MEYYILSTIDLSAYNTVPALYRDLLSLKKEVYQDNERIVILCNNSDKSLKLVKEILTAIDIPEFFVIFEYSGAEHGLDFELSPSHCVYPWINMEITTTGELRPCCNYKKHVANIADASIEDVYINKFQTLRNKFLAGDFPAECSRCWENENKGIPSMRQFAKYKFKDIYYDIDYQKNDFNNLQVLDLKLGNVCNLTCKICDRKSSSAIARNELEKGIISIVEFDNLKQSTLWADSDNFWDQLLPIIKNLKYLDLYGGEPLMSKMHFNFLKELVEAGVAENIKIDYNTNGTVYSDKFFDIWKYFKEIKLSFSIDDIDQRFEDQRCGASWIKVQKNVRLFNSKRNKKFITELAVTINTQNVYFIPELIDWFHTQNFDSLHFNFLSAPAEFNITSLDVHQKQKIISKLSQCTNHGIYQQIIDMLGLPNS